MNVHRFAAPCLMILLALAVTGCGLHSLGSSQLLVTKADERFVVATPSEFKENGRNRPRQVVCAEPSPDVAKAIGKSLDLSGSADVAARGAELPVEGALKMAAALSYARAETLAQLTNRLATIQLLRDGLFRACEAYANGALGDHLRDHAEPLRQDDGDPAHGSTSRTSTPTP